MIELRSNNRKDLIRKCKKKYKFHAAKYSVMVWSHLDAEKSLF